MAASGWTLGTIEPATGEEALSGRRNWSRQRCRWQKGFIQSWIVHMRRLRGYGWRRALALQMTVGATLVSGFLHVPAIIGMGLLALFKWSGWIDFTPPVLFYAVMSFGYSAAIATAFLGLLKSGRLHLWKSLFGMPFYWLWHFWPSLRAAWEMFSAPYYWHKTEHGRARFDAPPASR